MARHLSRVTYSCGFCGVTAIRLVLAMCRSSSSLTGPMLARRRRAAKDAAEAAMGVGVLQQALGRATEVASRG